MRLMLSYLKRYKGLVFLNFISVFGFALTELGIPTIISRMVDGGVASGDREYLLKMGGLIALISVVGILGTVVLGYCGARISTAVTCDIRNDLFEKVQSFSHREMNQLGVSSLITRTSNDALQIMNFMNIILNSHADAGDDRYQLYIDHYVIRTFISGYCSDGTVYYSWRCACGKNFRAHQ